MFLTYVRHKVMDFAQWRNVFDANIPMLRSSGVIDTWITKINDDGTDVAIVTTWPSRKNWDAFIAAHNFNGKDDFRKAQEKAGVIGEPEFVCGEVAGS